MKLDDIKEAFKFSLPIVLGYITIGLPCGLLLSKVGMNPLQVFLLSLLFYSGAGQFMVANMLMAGTPLASIVASVALVDTRHMLYSTSFAKYCQKIKKWKAFHFAATVTDESYGVSVEKFQNDPNWTVDKGLAVNIFCHSTWIATNVIGSMLGNVVEIPLDIATYAMTAIFVCLVFTIDYKKADYVAVAIAVVSVIICKYVGLTNPAILISSIIAVAGATLFSLAQERKEQDVI